MKPAGTRIVVPSTSWRDRLIAVIAGLLIFGFVCYGLLWMARPHESRNILTGVVVDKEFTAQREEQVSFSGRRIQGTKQIEGEYVLKVRVEKENRTYDVVVERPDYESKRKGDKLEFVRPRSEQR